MKKKLMIILVAAFLGGSLGLNAQVVNTDIPTEEEIDEDGLIDYYDGKETPLYEVKCPACGDRFAVDEQTLQRGFACPSCGENLIQAE